MLRVLSSLISILSLISAFLSKFYFYFFQLLCVWGVICICMCTCVWPCICVCMCGGQRQAWGVWLYCAVLYQLTNNCRWMMPVGAQMPQHVCRAESNPRDWFSPSTAYCARGFNSGPQVSVASPSATKPSSHWPLTWRSETGSLMEHTAHCFR